MLSGTFLPRLGEGFDEFAAADVCAAACVRVEGAPVAAASFGTAGSRPAASERRQLPAAAGERVFSARGESAEPFQASRTVRRWMAAWRSRRMSAAHGSCASRSTKLPNLPSLKMSGSRPWSASRSCTRAITIQ